MKMLGLALPVCASVALGQGHGRVRYPITEAAVAHLLQSSGVKVTASQVHLPTTLSASSPDPYLEIRATHKTADGRARLELRCHTAGVCLPFEAMLDVEDAQLIPMELHAQDSVNRSVERSVAGAASVAEDPAAGAQDSLPANVRVGSQVVLVIADGHMRIHLPAIAMDSGATGTSVRVCTPDRKKIFHATVMDAETVEGLVE